MEHLHALLPLYEERLNRFLLSQEELRGATDVAAEGSVMGAGVGGVSAADASGGGDGGQKHREGSHRNLDRSGGGAITHIEVLPPNSPACADALSARGFTRLEGQLRGRASIWYKGAGPSSVVGRVSGLTLSTCAEMERALSTLVG